MIGQCYGASGAIDGITALLSLQHKLIPPTINCEELDPAYGLNLVRDEARPMSQTAILVGGRGIAQQMAQARSHGAPCGESFAEEVVQRRRA